MVDATKYRRPLTLRYYEACLSKEKAIAREKYFKTGFGRRFLNSRI
jgi:predicted GIY-YIG superfamily endonuclease